jgi:hypothetical protein
VPLVDDGQDHHVEVHCQPCGPAQPRAWPLDATADIPGHRGGTA